MKENNSKVILVMVVGFLAIAAYLYWKTYNTAAIVMALIALGVGFLSLIMENAIVWIWGKFALALGWVNTRILLSAVFFIFLTPFAMLSRIFSKKSALRLKNDSKSTFVERNHTYTKKDLENIW